MIYVTGKTENNQIKVETIAEKKPEGTCFRVHFGCGCRNPVVGEVLPVRGMKDDLWAIAPFSDETEARFKKGGLLPF